ncbi:unnamed protein product [Diabrotica balteata]|uniref:Uncharacterized protein n=1 Tax=Diabrotica balteata TaxID=107213 RepID=A0A9N9X6Z0_DIABA|nr:unnamed protein product [Diabrotica balteata]
MYYNIDCIHLVEDLALELKVDVESLAYTSKLSINSRREPRQMVRPLSRKDIFYSGSVLNLPEYKSQKSLTNYRQSILSIPQIKGEDDGTRRNQELFQEINKSNDKEENPKEHNQSNSVSIKSKEKSIPVLDAGDICPCLVLPDSFKSALSQMLDVSLLKNPVFLMIGISNLFGMAGLYIPFVYLVECAKLDGIDSSQASFLLSIIGITNTVGRLVCGYIADFPQVNALFVNNCCLIISTIAVALTPLCHTYGLYVTVAIFFGIAVSGYISLTSIILVDLLGLEKLTNAFGLLILFRGAAAIIGSPLAGALYDATNSYDVPFYVGGGLFAISAITSFIAPCLKCFVPSDEPAPGDGDALTPIDEDEEEDDEPITMGGGSGKNVIPTIVETATSSPDEKEEIQLKESVL